MNNTRKRTRENSGARDEETTAIAASHPPRARPPTPLHPLSQSQQNVAGTTKSRTGPANVPAAAYSEPRTISVSKGTGQHSVRGSGSSATSRSSASAASLSSRSSRVATSSTATSRAKVCRPVSHSRPGAAATTAVTHPSPLSSLSKGACSPSRGAARGTPSSSTSSTMATAGSASSAAPVAVMVAVPSPPSKEERVWRAKREQIEEEVAELRCALVQLAEDHELTQDAIEEMIVQHERDVAAVRAEMSAATAAHTATLHALEVREDACLARKQRSLEEIEVLKQRVLELASAREAMEEQLVLEKDGVEVLQKELGAEKQTVAARAASLQALLEEEHRLQDTAYGLSGEVKEMVLEMERLQKAKRQTEIAAMETEVSRRELYAQCEELKGSIRVFCRVKGGGGTSSTTPGNLPPATGGTKQTLQEAISDSTATTPSKLDTMQPAVSAAVGEPSREGSAGSIASSTATNSTTVTNRSCSAGPTSGKASSRPTTKQLKRVPSHQARSSSSTTVSATTLARDGAVAREDEQEEEGEAEPLFTFPPQNRPCEGGQSSPRTSANGACEEDGTGDEAQKRRRRDEAAELFTPRTISVHQTRANATSTGVHSSTESFTYDRVFDGSSTQEEVYHEVEPLVNSAIDGYRVCVFAYGQTGSGKTYTMEGSMRTESEYGIIPRAMQTIFRRQGELAKDGWTYQLTCYVVEIYNDVIHDLLQSPSLYEPGGAAAGNNSSYHAVKHTNGNTTITNVREKRVRSMEEFRALYQQANHNRSTAKTQLNDRSSRSHCVFTLRIDGVNETIRQRSEGVLCLVDLAGSERVSESGAEGRRFKEAVSINGSLLDLGKCIHALRGGTVAPWRNSRLTYLLQQYLGAKGGKMLMVVTISNLRAHVSESMNSLRFALRVNDTVVGTSVRRVTSY